MKISSGMLNKAVEANILSEQQAKELLQFIKKQQELNPGFNLTNVLYYFGGFLAINAMTLFMTLGWQTFGGWGIFTISLCYAVLGLCLATLFERRGHKIPAGICATFVVALTPLAIYGLQLALGWWPDDTNYRDYYIYIRWNWIYLEFGTLLVGAILAWIYRYPFMVMPIGLTLWFLSMDLTNLYLGTNADFLLSAKISMYFGLVTLILAFWVDLRSRHSADYAFWLYLFGVLTFWGGLSAQSTDSELARFVYFCINLIMITLGVILVRKVFVIFGALGSFCYLGYLAAKVFLDSILFPFVLTLMGLAVIYLGTLWQKNEASITQKAQQFLPRQLRELLESRSED